MICTQALATYYELLPCDDVPPHFMHDAQALMHELRTLAGAVDAVNMAAKLSVPGQL